MIYTMISGRAKCICTCLLAAALWTATSTAAEKRTRGDYSFAPSVGLDELEPFVRRIVTGRGTILLHSDSRTLYAGHGIQAGLEHALAEHPFIGLFGTPAYSPGRNGGVGDDLGYNWTNNNSASNSVGHTIDPEKLPEVVQPYADPYDRPVMAIDSNVPHAGGLGVIALATSWLDLTEDLRLDVWHGVDTSIDAVLPRRRLNTPPWTAETAPSVIESIDASIGIRRSSVSWSSSQSAWLGSNTAVMVGNPGTGLPIDFRVHMLQVTRPTKTTGAVVSTRHRGGNSAIDNYNDIFPAVNDPNWTDVGRRFMLRASTHHSDGWLLVMTYLDVNDRNETLPSVNGITPGNSPAAYRDNIESTLDAYDRYAPDPCRVFHLLVGTPRLASEQNNLIAAYHHELASIASSRPRTGFLNLQEVMPDNEQLVLSGIFPNGSDVHQTKIGSLVIGQTIVSQLLTAAGSNPIEATSAGEFNCANRCPEDCMPPQIDGTFGNRVVNVDDLLRVLDEFGSASIECDVAPIQPDGTIGNGIVNVDDLFAVLMAFGSCE